MLGMEWCEIPLIGMSVANTGCLRGVKQKVQTLRLPTTDSSAVVTTLKLGLAAHTTTKAEAPNPVWNEDVQL